MNVALQVRAHPTRTPCLWLTVSQADVHAAAAAELSAIATDRAVLNGAARLLPKSAMTALGDLKRRERTAKASLARPVATALDQRAVARTMQARWDGYPGGRP